MHLVVQVSKDVVSVVELWGQSSAAGNLIIGLDLVGVVGSWLRDRCRLDPRVNYKQPEEKVLCPSISLLHACSL